MWAQGWGGAGLGGARLSRHAIGSPDGRLGRGLRQAPVPAASLLTAVTPWGPSSTTRQQGPWWCLVEKGFNGRRTPESPHLPRVLGDTAKLCSCAGTAVGRGQREALARGPEVGSGRSAALGSPPGSELRWPAVRGPGNRGVSGARSALAWPGRCRSGPAHIGCRAQMATLSCPWRRTASLAPGTHPGSVGIPSSPAPDVCRVRRGFRSHCGFWPTAGLVPSFRGRIPPGLLGQLPDIRPSGHLGQSLVPDPDAWGGGVV